MFVMDTVHVRVYWQENIDFGFWMRWDTNQFAPEFPAKDVGDFETENVYDL